MALAIQELGGARRPNRTKGEIAEFNDHIFAITERQQPCTSRHIYYQAVTARLIDKDGKDPVTGKQSRKNEALIWRALGGMRESGRMPFPWIVDHTRWRLGAELYDSKEAALRALAQSYRYNLWLNQPYRLEVWVEADSMAGMVTQITEEYGVDVLPCRGQASKGFVDEAARFYRRLQVPVVVLYIGDWDPAGVLIDASLEERMRRYSRGEAEIIFERLAINPDHLAELRNLSHPTNRGKLFPRFVARCRQLGVDPGLSVETEALSPDRLRGLLTNAIERYIDHRQLEIARLIEQEERAGLTLLATSFGRESG
ncbi:MAG: hypothetical protein DLM67_13820 [Candidatus Nephthysia bennettiae]|nr:MAG: hypothetical protein DLM67_13820 [Candidatus Dormibacteraeota bacterium]